jgi:hypothetical protein
LTVEEERLKAELGSAFHLGVAAYELGKVDDVGAADLAKEYYTPFAEPIMRQMEIGGFKRRGFLNPDECWALVMAYLMNFPLGKDMFTTYENYIEVGATLPIMTITVGGDEVEVILVGKIDRICSQDDELYIMDHKTTGHPDTIVVSPNFQFESYSAMGSSLVHRPIRGIVANVVRTSRNREGEYPVVRKITRFDDWKVDNWRRNLQAKAQEIVSYLRSAFWPQRTGHCVRFFRECTFIELCKSGPGPAHEALKRNTFQPQPWVPFQGAPAIGIEELP